MLNPTQQAEHLRERGMDNPLRCAWLSHHTPLANQREDLNARGFLVYPALREGEYVRNHVEAYEAAIAATGRAPDLIVAVLPVNMLAALAHYASPVPVWVAPMRNEVWGGVWRALEAPYVELVTSLVE